MNDRFFKSKILHDFSHDPSALVGSILLVLFILAALMAPWIAPQNPYDLEKVSLEHFLTPPIWMEGGTRPFLLGTDDQGRGILSTILYGCRTSLIVGLGVVLIAGSFGVCMGLLAGYYGG
ncbi:MAG: ABC transporter permease, partial [Proteobacteria bacterium]|nr:ABC transporter permease [Pseudomonadota bacterium]